MGIALYNLNIVTPRRDLTSSCLEEQSYDSVAVGSPKQRKKRFFIPKRRYTNIEHFFEGGMGTIYTAFDRSLGTDVAIKVMAKPESRSAFSKKRFFNEMAALSQISSDHVVQLTDPRPFLYGPPAYAMEHVKGFDLFDSLRKSIFPTYLITNQAHVPLVANGIPKIQYASDIKVIVPPQQFTVSVIAQTALGLYDMHEAGFLHRDVKPENILLSNGTSTKWGDVKVKLCDLGLTTSKDNLSKPRVPNTRMTRLGFGANGRRLTYEGTIIGTPFYVSPETTMGVEEAEQSDLYSLGTIMYGMLTGINPFQASSTHKVQIKQICGLLPPPSAVSPIQVLPELDDICMTLLQKTPGLRYQSGKEVAETVVDAFSRYPTIPLAGATHYSTLEEILH